MLAGIIHPSEGVVDVYGHVSGLLTLGAGFDKDLTGRDNILLGGAFLGLDDAVTRQLLPSIIEYAELGDFIDAPLKTYSSGMRARLGFAIATSVDPDILLLDEVLATGDANFRAKSKARVIEIVSAAKAVVLVTHDMNWVTEYCNRAVLIERGELVMEGEPAAVVELHRVHTEEARARTAEAAAAAGLDPRIVRVRGPLSAASSRRGAGSPAGGQRRRRAAISTLTTPATPATASAPRQSTSVLTLPSTRRAMTTPAKLCRSKVTWLASRFATAV